MKNKKTRIFIGVLVIAFIAIVTILVLSWVGLAYKTNIYELSCVPEELGAFYNDSYCVSLIEYKIIRETEYDIIVAREGNSTYGWRVNYWQDVENLEHTKNNLSLDWHRNYVTVTSWEGNEMKIYKDNFVGGR